MSQFLDKHLKYTQCAATDNSQQLELSCEVAVLLSDNSKQKQTHQSAELHR